MLICEKISKTFLCSTHREVKAIDELSIEMKSGEFVVMVGENGSGKTTFFNLVSGRLYPDSGNVIFDNRDITTLPPHRRARSITRVYQSRASGLPQSMTVKEVMRLALDSTRKGLRFRKTELARFMSDQLEQIKKGLLTLLNEQMWNISEGEHQLISLAVAAILSKRDPNSNHLLLLDEHVSQLDPMAHEMVMEITDKLIRDEGLSAIMTTHDVEVATQYGSRQIILSRGKIVADLAAKNRLQSAKELRKLLKSRSGKTS